MSPETLADGVRPVSSASRSAAATCSGTTTAFTPRSAKSAVIPSGDFTWAMGSPTIGTTRVSPDRVG